MRENQRSPSLQTYHKCEETARIAANNIDRGKLKQNLNFYIDQLNPEQHAESIIIVVSGVVATTSINA